MKTKTRAGQATVRKLKMKTETKTKAERKGKLKQKAAKIAKKEKVFKSSFGRLEIRPHKFMDDSPRAGNPLAGKVWTLEVERERLVPSPTNPRKDFNTEMLEDRAKSLVRQGQLVALIVRPNPECLAKRLKTLRARVDHGVEKKEKAELSVVEVLAGQQVLVETLPIDEEIRAVLSAAWLKFEIADGECRWRASAAKHADLKRLKCDVRCLSDDEVREIQWTSWMQRKDLNPLEEAEGLAELRKQGWTIEQLCERFNRSRTQIFEKLKLVKAEPGVRELVAEGKLNPSVAALIASVPDKAVQQRLIKADKDSYNGCAAFDHDGQARPVAAVAEYIKENCIRQIPWKLDQVFKHAELVSPACQDCPKMTRNMGEENPEVVKGPPRCMGLSCFTERSKAVVELRKQEAAAQGITFWPYEEFREKGHSRAYCVEGESNWGGEPSGKWEVIAKDMPHKVLAQEHDGSLKRIWRKEDLVAAGLVKDPKDTSAATSAQMKLDEKVFKATKAKVLELLLGALQESAKASPLVDDSTPSAILKAYFYAELLGYSEARERKINSVTVHEALNEMAKRLCGNRWYQLSEPPEGLELFGLDVKAIAEGVRAGLKEKAHAKTAKSAKKEKEEEGELVEA